MPAAYLTAPVHVAMLHRCSEATITKELQAIAEAYRRESDLLEMPELRRLADAVPTTFKAMLTLLWDLDNLSWDEEFYYDQCCCGFVYRCEAKDALNCWRCGRDK